MAWDRDKDRKAGRAMGIGSTVFGLVFAIFWCIMAAAMGAGFMLIFGIPFVGMMVYRLVLCLRYTKEEKNGSREPWERPADGWTTYQNEPQWESGEPRRSGSGYCPYCGAAVAGDFEYCPKCGRKLNG